MQVFFMKKYGNNQCYMIEKKANMLKIFKPSSENHLKKLDYIRHIDMWLP